MGVKTISTYPFPTTYVGPLIIYADNNGIPIEDPYILSMLTSCGYSAQSLPHDVEVARCKLSGCEKIKPDNIPCYPEFAFSEFKAGWYARKLADIEAADR